MIEGKQKFSISQYQTEEPHENAFRCEMQCTAEYATDALIRAILSINERVDDTGILKAKNGFWLILQDAVNERLQQKAGIDEE
ncbi:hypothetical protein J6V85_00215 [Candidatus Saccharibacteria bacterium]|nr:hypothetical protein [Candidatus Saccharibacteria bacterium]